MGSVHYFSPEHARGGFTDAKSDLYSLGVVLYEMLTGKVPFDADTPVSVALKHMQENPVEPIKINPAVPIAVNKIVMKAMKKDPSFRYQTATEMLKDLTLALKNPDGDFVTVTAIENDFPTQVIPTIEKQSMEEKIKAKDEQNGKKKKKSFYQNHKGLVISLILIILFALSLGGTCLVFNLTRSKDVQVPNLVGKTIDEVENTLKDTKLTYEVKEEKYDVTIDAGLVISQDPEYKNDYKIKENTKIGLVISLGQKLTNVPKVIGKTEEEARTLLEEADLEVIVVEEFDKKVEKGYVIKQDVAESTEVGAGSAVTITVSKGIEEATVPHVIGKPKADAISEIERAGLTVSTTLTEEDKTKDDGVVLKQSLEGGSNVEKGSSMTITVNQIEQLVSGNVKINLKSLLKYVEKYTTSPNSNTTNSVGNETGTTNTKVPIPAKDVKLKVTVDGETVHDEKHKEDETNIKVPISGVGTITVKVYVDDVLKSTKQLNLKNSAELVIE